MAVDRKAYAELRTFDILHRESLSRVGLEKIFIS